MGANEGIKIQRKCLQSDGRGKHNAGKNITSYHFGCTLLLLNNSFVDSAKHV